MYKILFKSEGQTEEYLSTDFGEVTDKVIEIKMKHHLWFVRGMYENREDGTAFFDVDLCDKRSEILISKNNLPLGYKRVSVLMCKLPLMLRWLIFRLLLKDCKRRNS